MANVITTASHLDQALITLLDKAFIVAGQDNIIADQFVTKKMSMKAKSIDIVKYAKMAKATSALTEGSDVDSVAVTDTKVTFTPAEYGNVVTKTSLRSLQSGGQIDLGIAQVVGYNMAESFNALAILAGEGSANEITVNASGESSTVAGNILTPDHLAQAYTDLASNNVMKYAGDAYVAVCHPHVVHDLADATGWKDYQKYADAIPIMKNEVGMLKGFRIIQSTGVSINENAGNSNVDTYHTLCVGNNALGYAESQAPTLKLTGPFDRLGRHVHVGWYGVFQFGIVDQDALTMITSSSSQGAN